MRLLEGYFEKLTLTRNSYFSKQHSVWHFRSFYPLITALAVLLSCTLSPAAEEPIQIEADKMTAINESQSVVFTGNVDARQGDIRIRSEEMTVYYIKSESGVAGGSKSAQQVKKITCTGNVEVTSKEWLGTADTMHYFSRKNLVQLVGNAKAYKGQNMVQGERINYHLDSGTSEVFGAEATAGGGAQEDKKSGRVNMTILEQ